MPINRIKSRITNLASGEILGEATEEEKKAEREKAKAKAKTKQKVEPKPERKPKPEKDPKPKRDPKPKKEKKVREPKEAKPPKERLLKKPDKSIVEEVELVDEETEERVGIKGAAEGYEDVLSILNIKEELKLDVDFQSQDLDYIEFSQTTPLGFCFEEVTDFISRVKYAFNKYESALQQRGVDVVILASEVKKVEQKMVEQNQTKELERMVGGMTSEERMIEENMDLKVEINNLKAKIISGVGGSNSTASLEKEILALRAENEMLIRKDIQSSTQEPSEYDWKLPNVGGEEKKKNTNSLPAFKASKEVEMPAYDEEEDSYLNEMMNNNKGSKGNIEGLND